MANTYDAKGIHGKELLDFGTEIAKKIRTDDEVIAASLNNLNSRLEAFENIENWGDILADSINTSEFPLVAGKPMIIVKAGTPSGTSTIPDYAGQFYVDSTNKVIYCSGGYSSVNDWVDVTNKIGTGTVGSATKPIYLNSGTPTAGSDYAGGTKVTLNGTDKGASTATIYAPTTAGTSGQILKSSGSGEPTWVTGKASDVGITVTSTSVSDGTNTFHKYTHPTSSGNKHVPSGGSSGQFLGWSADGTATWMANPNTDTKVKATAKTDNVNYKILATASASPTSGGATEAVYDADITLNPSTNTIAANISGDAATASAAKSGSTLATTISGKQDKLTAQTAYTAKGTATKVPQITTNSLGQVTGITEVTISGVAPASHTHGNIQDGGTLQTTDVAIASGDKLVITDSSNSNKIARSSASFDGSTTTTALTPKGTFEAFAKAADITSAINALDATKTSTDGTNVQVKVTEADGKITAVNVTTDTTANVNDSVYYVTGTTDYAQWTANTAYAVNDIVLYSSYARTCKTAHTSGSSFDSSKWNTTPTPVLKGSIPGITSLYAGLKIAYKWPCYGGQSSTYLNINGLGNVYIRRNDSNMTTHLPPNAVSFMAYDGTYWRWADYNSDAWVTSMGGYCGTAAGTAAKAADSSNTVLTTGMAMLIRFTQTNSAASKLTLNVNSQGAKDLWINGKVSSATNYTLPAGEHWCFYDGTNWYVWTDGTVEFMNVKSDKYIGLEYTNGENLVHQRFKAGSSNTSCSSDYTAVTISPENKDTHFDVLFAESVLATDTLTISMDVDYTGDDDGKWAWNFNFIGQVAGRIPFTIRGSGHYTATGVAGTSTTAETYGKFDDSTRVILPANSFTIKNIKVERGTTATGFCLCNKDQKAASLYTARNLAVNLANTSTNSTFDGSADQTGIKVSGTLPIANGGTSATTAKAAQNALLGNMNLVTTDPGDSTPIVMRYLTPTDSNGAVYVNTAGRLWNYMKGKMSSDTSVDISGNAATATSATSAGKLSSAKKLAVNLANTSTDSTFDGSADQTGIKVTGKLPIANGGTNATTAADARTNLSVYSKSEVDSMLTGRISVVTSLPATGEAGVIYFVGPSGSGSDQYEEYVWNGTQFVKVGEKSLDLSNYVNTLSTSGSGSVLTNLTKSGNTLTVTKGNISLDNLSTWASKTDETIGGTSYHTYWQVAPTSSNTVYGIAIKDGNLYQVKSVNNTKTVRAYDKDDNTTYTQEKLGQGYGTCTTPEATAAKAVSITNYELVTNGIIAVKFSYGLCASATLNVNSKGAKPIYIHGAAATATTAKEVKALDVAYFMYDGTYYQFLGTDRLYKDAITGLSISGKTITYTKADGTTGDLTTQDTTYTFDGTYNASTNKAATVSTVTNKIAALDVSDITGFGAGKTLATLTETDGKIAATFQNISITKSQVSDFPTSMTPTSHAHGNIANGGTLTDTAAAAAGNDYVVIRDADNAKIQTSTIKGTDVADAVSKKHGHSTLTLSTTAQIYDGTHTLALPASDPYTSARTPTSHTHGNISNAGAIGTTSGYAVYTTTNGVLTAGTLATSDPTASGNTLSFIDTISQDAKGKITATKKSVTVDTALSSTSTNPVQNKVINTALAGKQNTLTEMTETEVDDLLASLT